MTDRDQDSNIMDGRWRLDDEHNVEQEVSRNVRQKIEQKNGFINVTMGQMKVDLLENEDVKPDAPLFFKARRDITMNFSDKDIGSLIGIKSKSYVAFHAQGRQIEDVSSHNQEVLYDWDKKDEAKESSIDNSKVTSSPDSIAKAGALL